MRISISCRCGRSYMVTPGSAPKAARCQACGASLVIPARPSDVAAERARRRRLWKKVLLWTAVPIGSLLLLALVVLLVYIRSNSARAEAALAGLRAAGEPTTIAEIVPPAVPRAENAALLYQEAFDAAVEADDPYCVLDDFRVGRVRGTLPVEDRDRVERHLAANRKSIDLARRAARLRRCRFDLDWSRDMNMLLPHLAPMKELVSTLTLDARWRSRKGDVEGALESLEAAFACGEAFDSERLLICHLVRTACFRIGLGALRTILSEQAIPVEAARRWIAHLGTIRGPERFIGALQGERCLGLAAFLRLAEDPESFGVEIDDRIPWLWTFLGLDDVDRAEYVWAIGEMIEMAKLPYWEQGDRLAAFDAHIEAMPIYCIGTRGLAPAIAALLEQEARFRTETTAARIALELSIRRSEGRPWPDRIDDLGPLDEVTGGAIGYERGVAGIRIWIEAAEYSPDVWFLVAGRLVGWQETGISHVAWSPDGRRLVVASEEGPLHVLDAASGRELGSLGPAPAPVAALTLDGSGCLAAVLAGPGQVHVWEIVTGDLDRTIEGAAIDPSGLAVHPSGEWLAVAGRGARGWGLADGALRALPGSGRDVRTLAFAPDGSALAGGDTGLEVWDLATGRSRWRSGPIGESISHLAFWPDGTRIASGTEGGDVYFWDAASGERRNASEGLARDPVAALAVSPDGRWVAAGYPEGSVTIWDAKTLELRNTVDLSYPPGEVLGLAFRPDGEELAIATRTGRRAWKRPEGLPGPMRPPRGPSRYVEVWAVRDLLAR